jgi:hypothetical protein
MRCAGVAGTTSEPMLRQSATSGVRDTWGGRAVSTRKWALDPESKVLLAIDVGERTLAMAQHVVHHVAQVLAPDCAPLILTDGLREYLTALLTHYGHWVQPPRRQDKGPQPQPRWMPCTI